MGHPVIQFVAEKTFWDECDSGIDGISITFYSNDNMKCEYKEIYHLRKWLGMKTFCQPGKVSQVTN